MGTFFCHHSTHAVIRMLSILYRTCRCPTYYGTFAKIRSCDKVLLTLPPHRSSSLRNELMGQDSLKNADAAALVDEVLQDVDLAKYFDEEFEVSIVSLYQGKAVAKLQQQLCPCR